MNRSLHILFYIWRNILITIIILFAFISHNCSSLNRTKRTIGILRRPDKSEAIDDYISPKPGYRERTRFYLYTRLNAQKSEELTIGNEELLLQSSFNPELPIKVVINGWLDNRIFAKWVRSGISALLLHGNYNVIYVGWKSIKELFVAAYMIKLFSQDLAQFLIFLKNAQGINGGAIHCIGHSLGAFLCGFAGSLTYIGRLTDAGPRAWYESMAEPNRINRWQAGFVDVIHSDFNPALSWGLTIPIGDVDFYPNSSPQPGCLRDKFAQGYRELRDEGLVVGVFQWLRYLLFCSHYRSHEWFFESVQNRKCTFIGVRCHSYQMFMNGECGCDTSPQSCAVMGIDSDSYLRTGIENSLPGKWFIKTSDFVKETGAHCLFQYQIVVQMGQYFPQNKGIVFITIHSQNGRNVTQEVLKAEDNRLYPLLRFGKLAVRQSRLKNIIKISISWTLIDSVDPYQSVLSWIGIEYVKVAPILISNNRKNLVKIFCRKSAEQIRPEETIDLKMC